jgi:hypothetical protein
MSTSLLVAKERQPSFPFGLGHKQAKKPKIYGANAPQLHPILKKYGANAPQLHPIRCSIDFCVMLCNEQAKKPKKYGANAPQLRAIRCSIEYYVMLCSGMLRDLQYSLVKMSTSEISRIEALQPARQNMVSCIVGYAQAENSTRERPMADNQHL